jgi:uncharacterized protein YndB with AHSA1/START domain
MMPATIAKEITIHAPAAHVWQFVGTEAGLRQWWQLDVTLEAKAGGRCSERGLLNGLQYQLDGIVTTYDPPRQLVLRLAGEQAGAAWPTAMHITITLEEVGGATVVRVVHQVATASPTAASFRPPEPAHVQPLRQLPPILNQLPRYPHPSAAEDVSTTSPAAAGQPAADLAWINAYTAWWTARLVSLLQLTTVKGESR